MYDAFLRGRCACVELHYARMTSESHGGGGGGGGIPSDPPSSVPLLTKNK